MKMTNRKKRIILIIKNLILLAFLTGCNSVEFGKVVNKEFIAAHHLEISTVEPSLGFGWDGKPQTRWNIVQKKVPIPDKFLITIITANGTLKKICLNKEEYDYFNLGDNYPHFEKP